MNAPPPAGLFPANAVVIPRFREAGDVTLDLMHRDGRVDDRWLALKPREFALLWRLAQQPGEPVAPAQLLADVWRLEFAPKTNSLALHIARLRAKLAPFGLARLIGTACDGSYFIDAPPGDGLYASPRSDGA